MVTMGTAIMDPAIIGGQVWGSMSDLVGVIGISLSCNPLLIQDR